MLSASDIKQIAIDTISEHIKEGKGLGLNYRFYPTTMDGGSIYDSILLPAVCINNRRKLFPNRVSYRKDPSTIDLIYSRSEKLKNGNTENAKKVYTFLKNYARDIEAPNIPLIREYIIPIDEPSKWINFVIEVFGKYWYHQEKNNNDCKISGLIYRSFISLDIYSPKQSLAIEADSSKFHTEEFDENADKVRDKYLESLGIKTCRVLDFNPRSKKECEDLATELNESQVQKTPYYPEPKRLEQAISELNGNLPEVICKTLEESILEENYLHPQRSTQTIRILTALLRNVYNKHVKTMGERQLMWKEKFHQMGNFLITMKTIVNKSISGLDSPITKTDIWNLIKKLESTAP